MSMLTNAGSGLLRQLSRDVKIVNSALQLEFVRWRRKPRWLPVAKSKLYRVPEHKPQSPEQKAELQRLHNGYKTQMRSVRAYLREEMMRMQKTTTADHIVLTPEQEAADFEQCLQLNAAWNQEIAAEREKRIAKERAERLEYIKERLALAEEREEQKREHFESIVAKQKELAKTFITRETLDAAIERALANPVDYNFSIDLQGNIYRGRHANATQAEQQTELVERKSAATSQ